MTIPRAQSLCKIFTISLWVEHSQHSPALMGSTPVAVPVQQDLGGGTSHSIEAERNACAGALSETSALRGRPQATAYLEQLRKPFGAANSTSLTAVRLPFGPLPELHAPPAFTVLQRSDVRQAMTHRLPGPPPLSVSAFEPVASLHPGIGVLQRIPGGITRQYRDQHLRQWPPNGIREALPSP